jgi:acetyl esterase
MPLLPALESAAESLAKMSSPPDGLSVAEHRAWMHERIDETFTAMNTEHPAVANEDDRLVPVDGGNILARVYRPAAAGPLPCYLYLHGGGFWLGTLDAGDSACRGFASDAECVVVNLDYRLAPEHKFPTAAEDGYAALLWIQSHAAELGVDPGRIAVGGGSAGGNLAAAVCLMTRDRSGPSVALQILEIPVFDLRAGGKLYLATPEDANNPYASPLLAPDLHGLPPALIMTAEYDRLAPQGAAYALRLREAGVAVEERCWEGQFHGSMQLAKLIPREAAAYHAQVVDALRRAFDSAPSTRS